MGKKIAYGACAFMWLAAYMNSTSEEEGWWFEYFIPNIIVSLVVVLISIGGKILFIDKDIKGAIYASFLPLLIWGVAVAWGLTNDPSITNGSSSKGMQYLEEKSRVADAPMPLRDTYYEGQWWNVKEGDYLYPIYSFFGWSQVGVPAVQKLIFWGCLGVSLLYFFGFLLTWGNAKAAGKAMVSKKSWTINGPILLGFALFLGGMWAYAFFGGKDPQMALASGVLAVGIAGTFWMIHKGQKNI